MDCRLILVTPAMLAPPFERFGETLSAALDAGDVACVVLRSAEVDDAALRAAIAALRPPTQRRDVAFIVQDRVETAAATGCDGVHLSDAQAYRAARDAVGEDAIVGVACGDSRHDAMTAGERGADYVAFGGLARPADPELLAWWQQLMTVPCVALGAASAEDSARFARAGADFVAVAEAVWDDPQGPAAAVAAIERAIASSRAS